MAHVTGYAFDDRSPTKIGLGRICGYYKCYARVRNIRQPQRAGLQ